MMAAYFISPKAETDIRDIYDYIAADSIGNADRVFNRLIKQFDAIAQTPGIGHKRPELNDESLRVISIYNFLVIYRATARPIQIVRVIHGAMDLGPEFRR